MKGRGMKRAVPGGGEGDGEGELGGADAPGLLVMLAAAELPVSLTDGRGEHLNSPSQSALQNRPLSHPVFLRRLSSSRLLFSEDPRRLHHQPASSTPGMWKLSPPGPESNQVFSGGLKTWLDWGADWVPTPMFYASPDTHTHMHNSTSNKVTLETFNKIFKVFKT